MGIEATPASRALTDDEIHGLLDEAARLKAATARGDRPPLLAGRVLGLRAMEKHINSRGFVHGGVFCGMADLAIGYFLAFAQDPPLPLVTANLSVDFAGSARLGDWLECRVDLQRMGGRLAFANAYIWRGTGDSAERAAERIIRASAIFARADGGAS